MKKPKKPKLRTKTNYWKEKYFVEQENLMLRGKLDEKEKIIMNLIEENKKLTYENFKLKYSINITK